VSDSFLRPMGVGDILDATFRLYRRNFVTFALIGLAAYVPYALIMAPTVASQGDMSGVGAAQARPVPGQGFPVAGMLGGLLFALVAMPLCSAALTLKISSAYLDQPMSAAEAYGRALPRLFPLLITNFFVSLFIGLGFVLLIVPGIIFALWCMVVLPVVVLERRWGTGAMNRSRELMRDNLSKGFLLGLAVLLLGAILGWAITLIVALVPWPHVILSLVVTYAVQALILPIQTAPALLLYYDLRIRKEAFDLEQLASSLTDPPAAV
jgi:hypothetical protein